MRVVLVDDHPMYREGLRAALASAETEIVGEAGTVAEASQVVAATEPDVVLMDLQLPDGTGIDATRWIRESHPEVRVIALTMTGDEDAVLAALAAGASGYLLKGADRDTILAALAAVHRGEAVLGAGVAAKVLGLLATSERRPLPELSDREREVLALVADGLTNAAIAQRLFVSPKTIRNHVSNILTKLQVPTREDAGRRGREAGL